MGNLLGKNLSFLRKKNSFNQAKVASVVNKGSTTIGNWEKGVSEPNISELVSLSQLFWVSIDDLLKVDLSKGNLSKLQNTKEIEKKGNLKGKVNGNPFTEIEQNIHNLNEPDRHYLKAVMPSVVVTDQQGNENIVFVPVKARAGYLLGYGDTGYIEQLPSFRMPGLSGKTYRMFEVEGPSMSPTIEHNDRVIGEWVENLEDIRENRVYIVVHRGGVAVKRVVNRIKERGVIYLKSDTIVHRSDFPTIEIDPADILEIWYVVMRITGNLREPSELYKKINDFEINQFQLLKDVEALKAALMPPK